MKLLIGGSPCTHWSIAQTKNRETEASGIGWELFLNYRIARDKYQPDFFLYENNKSMAPAIKAQISKELGVEPVLINSALVSAQNRQRLYWVGKREPDGTYSQVAVEQPADRGILLRDILESGVCWREKAYTLKANYFKSSATSAMDGGHFPAPMAAEPVNMTADGKAQCLRATCYKDGIRNMVGNTIDRKTCVAEPVRIGTIENDAKNQTFDSQQYRVYSPDAKSVTLCGNGGGLGAKTGSAFEMRDDQKSNAVTATGHQSRLVVESAIFQRPRGFNLGGVKYKKAPTLTANGDWQHNNVLIVTADGKQMPVYEVFGGQITIKGKTYSIKLADGFYIIRKLTVTECKRLQTVPDTYAFPVSDTQAYKMLGNGWTVDVIAHIMSHFTGLTKEPVKVLSMYDGMSCGHIALDKLGVDVTAYYATEIDKYAIQTTQHNYPDTVQLGDAFQVRNDDWGPVTDAGGGDKKMERLTTRNANCADPKVLYGVWVKNHDYISAANRLADYEDTELTPEEIDMDHEAAEQLRHLCRDCDLGRLEELVKADKEGRTVVLPCKVGDTLYRVFAGEILEHKVGNMRYLAIQGRWDIETYPFCSYVESSIGKTIFLTREEAEAALEAKSNA